MVSTLELMQVPNGTGPGVRRSKRPLLASRTRCSAPWKPPKSGNKVKIVNKVQFGNKFANWCNVWSIECVIVYGYVPECHVTFGRGRLWTNNTIFTHDEISQSCDLLMTHSRQYLLSLEDIRLHIHFILLNKDIYSVQIPIIYYINKVIIICDINTDVTS